MATKSTERAAATSEQAQPEQKKKRTSTFPPELRAMAVCERALAELDEAARRRVMSWLAEKMNGRFQYLAPSEAMRYLQALGLGAQVMQNGPPHPLGPNPQGPHPEGMPPANPGSD